MKLTWVLFEVNGLRKKIHAPEIQKYIRYMTIVHYVLRMHSCDAYSLSLFSPIREKQSFIQLPVWVRPPKIEVISSELREEKL